MFSLQLSNNLRFLNFQTGYHLILLILCLLVWPETPFYATFLTYVVTLLPKVCK